jgi:DMSO/TMAO reductase YedYZ molybdopterin-dependent catalytic subunit
MSIDMYKRPSWLWGLLMGLVSVPVVMAVFNIGDRFAGLPFVPFDVFDFTGRILPGGLITFVIDTMVSLLISTGLGGNLDVAAKNTEQFLGLVMFFGVCVVSVTIFFELLNRLKAPLNNIPGLVFGLVFGVPMVLISAGVNRTATAEPIVGIIWTLMVCLGWGFVLMSMYISLYNRSIPLDDRNGKGMPRRDFLVQVGGASAVLTVFSTGLVNFLTATPEPTVTTVGITPDASTQSLPNANDPVQAVAGTRPEYTPLADHYRIDISARPPVVEEETFMLRIHGAVENPLELTLADIRNMPQLSAFITMACISNPIAGELIGTTKWTGVSFQHLLGLAKPTSDATALWIHGADNFDEYVDLSLINADERVMLSHSWDDQPLTQLHGFPLRIHIPDRYGMKQPKWIIDIEVVTERGEGYWVRRGWSKEAMVRTTSVIDTVAVDGVYQNDNLSYVPIGGIAWAGARGISNVQVRFDGGEWQDAQLRAPLSERTWVIWRYDWAFQPGTYNVEVRAIETDDTPQIEEVAGVRPDGATGLHDSTARL